MRVAYDITVPARASTGVAVYARHLLAALNTLGVAPQAWQAELGARAPGHSRVAAAARLLAWHQWQVPRRVRRDAIAVYHSACSVGPLMSACPVVLSVHDATLLTMQSQYGPADRVYHRVFSVVAARRACAVLVPTYSARESIAHVYRIPLDRLHVTPHGVSPAFAPVPAVGQDAVLRKYGIDRPYVLFVGAEPPRKNLTRLVRAFAHVAARPEHASLRLVLAGPPEPRDPAARRAVDDLGLAERVVRSGPVPDEDLPALYSAASCLAYPSLSEGFGLPVVEAMATGTPVLTSDRSSMAEVAGGAALLVDPESTDAIADGLASLLGNQDLARDLAHRGRERSRDFTWERTARATAEVYRAVAR
jgi:glycosyltransferase involved in cell wall biosynthesis